MTIPAALRRAVIQRAGDCCEYCRLAKTDESSPFHVDHVTPIKHHGTDDLDNLCLSCFQCNSYKGPNLAAADPSTGKAEFLFNPRTQTWDDHFQINDDATLTGKTPEGRVTIDVLRINDEPRVQYRQFAMSSGEYPC
ncbi:MAG: HNH endonuclease [Burkholderiales bacterium]|nr:HNH endonuclease [Anaerolineae bacterium]